MRERLVLLVLVLPLVLTCALNGLTLGPFLFLGTFSARTGRAARTSVRWGRVAAGIDAVFGLHHCEGQAKHEDAHDGNVWRAWLAEWGTV